MAFIPAYKHETAPVPFEYYPAGAIQNLEPGTLLYLNAGKLAVAAGTTKPQFIAHHTGTTADVTFASSAKTAGCTALTPSFSNIK